MSSYHCQSGKSLADIRILRQPYRIQKGSNFNAHYTSGRGLGNVFKGLLRFLTPILKSSGKAIAREAFSGGIDVIDELDQNRDQNFEEILKNRMKKGGANLKEKAVKKLKENLNMQSGTGLKRRRRKKTCIKKKLEGGSIKLRKNAKRKKMEQTLLGLVKRSNLKKSSKKTVKRKKTKATDIFD